MPQATTAQQATLSPLSPADRVLADSLLAQALDHEGLYTMLTDLKPISTVRHFSLPVAKDSTMPDGHRQVVQQVALLDSLARYQRVLPYLGTEEYRFALVPFRQVYDQERTWQIVVYRPALLDRLMAEKSDFFGQWGFVKGTTPEVLLTVTEFEAKHDRYRAYGYLFGYPDHAVDFLCRPAKKRHARASLSSAVSSISPYTADPRGILPMPYHSTISLPRPIRRFTIGLLARWPITARCAPNMPTTTGWTCANCCKMPPKGQRPNENRLKATR